MIRSKALLRPACLMTAAVVAVAPRARRPTRGRLIGRSCSCSILPSRAWPFAPVVSSMRDPARCLRTRFTTLQDPGSAYTYASLELPDAMLTSNVG